MLLDLLRFWWKPSYKSATVVARHMKRNCDIPTLRICACRLSDKARRMTHEESLADERGLYKMCRAAGPPNRVATDHEGRDRENVDYLRARATEIGKLKNLLMLMGPEVDA